MANMHVLTQSNSSYRIVLHIAVPATNNPAGFPWQTVLLRSGIGGTTVLPDGDGTGGTISAAEKTSITNGSVLEIVDSLDVTQRGALTTLAQINAFLDAYYTARSNEVLASLQAQLAQYGRVR